MTSLSSSNAERPASRRPWTSVVHEWATTVDHKKLGIMYVSCGIFFLIVAGLEASAMRAQLAFPRNDLISPEVFNQLFTMHGTTMVFLVGMPILLGMGNYLVPLQIGARDMAFPRLNAFGFWLFVFGAILLYSSYIAAPALFGTSAAPDTGWFAYAPLTSKTFSRGNATDYWILGVMVSGFGSMTTAINLVATALSMRCPGMTLMRMPLFTWMMLIVGILALVAIPVLTAAQVMLLFDRSLGAHFFDTENGGDAVLWQHLFWFFGHPEVYILILPAFGFISEIIPVFSRKVIFGYSIMVAATVAILFISLGVWAHHMFVVGLGPFLNALFSAATFLVSVPTGIKIFNWIATMWGGRITFHTPMLFAVGFLSMFVMGGLTGIMLAVVPFDWQLSDSYFVVGHFHYVLIGGTVFGIFAGLYYWFPKATGRMLSERLGKWVFWLLLIGFNVTFGPMHVSGILGMPRRIATYEPDRGWDTLNLISSCGVIFQIAAVALFAWSVIQALRVGRRAGNDPWNAWTLEWATTSPPPEHNFDIVPVVGSRRPLWDAKHPDDPDSLHEAQPVANGSVLSDLLVRPERGKCGMASFILMEACFFATFVVAYLFYIGKSIIGPLPAQVLDRLPVIVNSIALISSSFTAVAAVNALRQGRLAGFKGWLLATILLGGYFIFGTAQEWGHLIWDDGLTIGTNVFGTTFYSLVGFHAFHVIVGLTCLTGILLLALRGHVRQSDAGRVELVAWYWHFVDAVWIVVFTVVYLVGMTGSST